MPSIIRLFACHVRFSRHLIISLRFRRRCVSMYQCRHSTLLFSPCSCRSASGYHLMGRGHSAKWRPVRVSLSIHYTGRPRRWFYSDAEFSPPPSPGRGGGGQGTFTAATHGVGVTAAGNTRDKSAVLGVGVMQQAVRRRRKIKAVNGVI